MTHPHDNGHHHHHSTEADQPLAFKDKMDKLLSHWIHHNDDHAANYLEWAQRADEEKQTGLAAKLKEAARLTDQITETFREAAQLL